MDSITQGLLGATVAQLGFRQRIGRDATWVAALAAYSPDLDTFVPAIARMGGNTDPFIGLLTHRAWTHSLLLAPLIALVFALPWLALRRLWHRRRQARGGQAHAPPTFGLLYALCLLAVLTHAPLDLLTSYGTQIFSPITNQRFAGHAVGIIDLIYTPLLIVTLLTCWAVRKVKNGSPRRVTLIIGWTGLVLSCAYLAAGLGLGRLARSKALAYHEPETVVSAEAYPTIGTILLWRTVIETPDEWIVTRVHHLSDQTPRSSRIPKAEPDAYIERARETRAYRIYDWFSSGNLRAAHEPGPDGGHEVYFHDMRYSMGTDSAESLWPLRFSFGAGGELQATRRTHQRGERSIGEFAAALWKDIWDF